MILRRYRARRAIRRVAASRYLFRHATRPCCCCPRALRCYAAAIDAAVLLLIYVEQRLSLLLLFRVMIVIIIAAIFAPYAAMRSASSTNINIAIHIFSLYQMFDDNSDTPGYRYAFHFARYLLLIDGVAALMSLRYYYAMPLYFSPRRRSFDCHCSATIFHALFTIIFVTRRQLRVTDAVPIYYAIAAAFSSARHTDTSEIIACHATDITPPTTPRHTPRIRRYRR